MKRGASTVMMTILAIFLTAAVVHCSRDRNGPASPAAKALPGNEIELTHTVLMTGLKNPWDLAFTPDGAMLFTEKCRGLSVRLADGTARRLFGTNGSAVVADDFFCQGQSGMCGVAVDPDFADNRFLYVYMASRLDKPAGNRVVRLVVDEGYRTVTDRRDIVTGISFKNSATLWGRAGAHSGGRLRFNPDNGFLHITTGDNHEGPLPQDLSRLGGKVLRVDRHGRAAPGNNTPSGGDQRIFTYGHRNVQGIAFRPGSGQSFACEHGPGHSDEVTPLVAGGNGGWDPQPIAGVSCAGKYCGYTSNKPDGTPTSMTDLARFPDAMRPSWDNKGESEGMGDCVFLSGEHWQAWDGRLAVAFLRGSRIDLLQLNPAGKTVAAGPMAGLPSERIRSLVQGPDGALYVATDGGEIWRIATSRK